MTARAHVIHPVVQVLVALAALVVIGAGICATVVAFRVRRDVSHLTQRFDRAASGLDVVSRTAAELQRVVSPGGKGERLSSAQQQLQLTYREMQQVNRKLDTMNRELAAVNGNLVAMRTGVRGTPPPRR